MKTCYLCEKGFPLAGDKHIPTQSLGMIPVMRCELKVKRGDIAAFRLHLNLTQRHGDLHHNGPYRQKTRGYGDYLYHQDREKFDSEMLEWLATIEP